MVIKYFIFFISESCIPGGGFFGFDLFLLTSVLFLAFVVHNLLVIMHERGLYGVNHRVATACFLRHPEKNGIDQYIQVGV